MSKTRKTTRFAGYDEDGDLTALVAEGAPEWPESGDLSAVSDDDLGALHDAYMAQAPEMRAALSSDDPEVSGAVDLELATALPGRIDALRTEAASRMTTADEAQAEFDALSEDDRAAVVAWAEAVAAIPPAPAPDPNADSRAAALAALTGIDAAPAPTFQVHTETVDVQTLTAEGITAATVAGITALAPTLATAVATATVEALADRIPAQPRRGNSQMSPADLAAFNRSRQPIEGNTDPRQGPGRLVHTGDAPGLSMGQSFDSMDQLVNAFSRRWDTIGKSAVSDDEKVIIASYKRDETTDPIPASRDFRSVSDQTEVWRKVQDIVGPNAMGLDPWNLQREVPISRGGICVADPDAVVASGGLSAPVEPYYPQLCLSQADRPVLGAMPSVVANRGGIRLVQPSSLGTLLLATTPGQFTDGVTNDSTTFTSATAAFTAADIGSPIVQTAGATAIIPAGTVIVAVGGATSITLSQASTGGSVTGVTFAIRNRNPNNLGPAVGLVTAAQDAAGPPNTLKYTYDVPIGSQIEHDVYSVYASLQFANLTSRTFPEQVELNILLANALAARTLDAAALDYMTGWSTLFTGAKTFGTARQLLAQFEHMAAYYRNHNRMDPMAVLRLAIPAWTLNAMRGDVVSTLTGVTDAFGLSDEELMSWFADRHILPTWYWDGPTDVSQLFPSPGSGAINTGGVNNATPVAIPDYPGTGSGSTFRTNVVSYMWGEGTWLGLTTGELNIGLVRDSILNSQNRFRNFEESWETPAFVGFESLRAVHTIASDGSYGAAVSVVLGAGSGL